MYTIKNKIVKKITCFFINIFIEFNRTQKMVRIRVVRLYYVLVMCFAFS